MEHLSPGFFLKLKYFQGILLLIGNLWCALQDEVYIMGCGAAGARDVIQDGGHIWLHWKWEVFKRRRKLTIFGARHLE